MKIINCTISKEFYKYVFFCWKFFFINSFIHFFFINNFLISQLRYYWIKCTWKMYELSYEMIYF